jgi:hypothetical protein
MWANYYATGDVALIKKIIKEGLLLANQARMSTNPMEAQLLMQACNYAAVSLVNEGTPRPRARATRSTRSTAPAKT